MTASIPASNIASVTPSVVSAGGTGLNLGGLFLTNSTQLPVGGVLAFATSDAVGAYFGLSSNEYLVALRYFAGYDNSSIKPAQLLFSQYASVAVPAYMRGASVAALTLAQLQAIAGPITITLNGTPVTSSSINLSAAASFSAAAALIQTAFSFADASVTGSISGTTLTVTAVASGTLAVGQVISGTGITAGTKITALGTGTGGTGTYTVSVSQTASSTAVTAGAMTVTYDSVSGAFVFTMGTPGTADSITVAATGTAATALALTTATGAVTSAGSAVMTPGTAMAAIAGNTQNFASFATIFQPSVADMTAFAAWANSKSQRYVYVQWDNDVSLTTNAYSTTALYAIQQAKYAGTFPIYTPTSGSYYAAMVMGTIASINFNATNGRTNVAFRAQAGLAASVTSETIAAQLIANGCNFYGAYATAAQGFIFLYPGSVTGAFLWADSLVNEIWMTNAFQLALMSLLSQVLSIPYNDQGYALIEAALSDPVNAAVNFGAIRQNVPLSALQAAQVNQQAGVAIDSVLSTRGWYLQVKAPSAQVRAARGTPVIILWYMDGQSVQSIALNSVEVA